MWVEITSFLDPESGFNDPPLVRVDRQRIREPHATDTQGPRRKQSQDEGKNDCFVRVI